MENNNIFNNYLADCPMCGGNLDAEHKFCPFCGCDLSLANAQHRENEETIKTAISDIDDAKQQIEEIQTEYEDEISKHESERAVNHSIRLLFKIILFGVIAFLLIGSAIALYEGYKESKLDQFKQDLLSIEVDTITRDAIDLEGIEFVDTKKQSVAGHVQESEFIYAIPFYDSNYHNDAVFKGHIYFTKEQGGTVGSIEDTYAYIDYDDCQVSFSVHNNSYSSTTASELPLYDWEDAKNTTRLDNIKVGDITFECYRINKEYSLEYVMIANPYVGCFICVETSYSPYDTSPDDIGVDDLTKMIRVDCSFELQ